MNTAVIVRILLRYGAAFLVTKGILSPNSLMTISNDPDIQQLLQIILGLGFSIASEVWMYIAKKFGWAT